MSLLVVRNLTRRFGGLVATDGVDLDVAAGEIHAIIGPNGAGKSTLIAQLSGTLKPDGGHIVFDGGRIERLSAHRRVALGLARSYQVTQLFNRFSAHDNVSLAVQAAAGSSFRFWRPLNAETAIRETAQQMLESAGLGARGAVVAAALAHGEQRRLEVALALATRPQLLLLDEPMAGMGMEESGQMIELIARLKGTLAIVLVEHDMDAVFRLADRISVLVRGRVVQSGSPEAIRMSREVQDAYLGTEVVA